MSEFRAWLERYWPWLLLGAAFLFILPPLLPGIVFYWGYGSFKSLFYDAAGLGQAWSSFLAVLFAVLYALVFPFSLRWLMFGRRRFRAVIGTVVVFGIAPLLHAVFDSNFNRATGAAQKCYVWRPGGKISLSDGCGFDPALGAERRPLTPEVARIIEREKQGLRPNLITADPKQISFFDAGTGRPRIWYYEEPNGGFRLFDSEGFNPTNGALLLPVTAEIAARIKEDVISREARAKIEAKAQAERTEAEARDRARRELRELFGTDSYSPGTVIVGVRSHSPSDEGSVEAAKLISAMLLKDLRAKGLPVTELRVSVYTSPYYDQLMTGDATALVTAGLSQKMRSALFSLAKVSCQPATSLSGVLSCSLTFDLRTFRGPGPDQVLEHWTEIGAGTTREEAVSQAVKGLINRRLVPF